MLNIIQPEEGKLNEDGCSVAVKSLVAGNLWRFVEAGILSVFKTMHFENWIPYTFYVCVNHYMKMLKKKNVPTGLSYALQLYMHFSTDNSNCLGFLFYSSNDNAFCTLQFDIQFDLLF